MRKRDAWLVLNDLDQYVAEKGEKVWLLVLDGIAGTNDKPTGEIRESPAVRQHRLRREGWI